MQPSDLEAWLKQPGKTRDVSIPPGMAGVSQITADFSAPIAPCYSPHDTRVPAALFQALRPIHTPSGDVAPSFITGAKIKSHSSRPAGIAEGCSLHCRGRSDQVDNSVVPSASRALDNVTLITDFGYNGHHACFFEALDRGYYRDAGFEVKIVRGQGSADAIRHVPAMRCSASPTPAP
jgi:hypothetical protein